MSASRPRVGGRRWGGVGRSAWTLVLPREASWWARTVVRYAALPSGVLGMVRCWIVVVQAALVLLAARGGWAGLVAMVAQVPLLATVLATGAIVDGRAWVVRVVRALVGARLVAPVRLSGSLLVHSGHAADLLTQHDPGLRGVIGDVLWDAGQERVDPVGVVCCPVHGLDAARTDEAWREWSTLARRAARWVR